QQKLNQICPELFSGYPIEFAYLYGSHATGVAHPFSDIDIGIYLNKSINKKDYLKIELQVGLKLDETLDYVAQSEVRIINALPLMIRGEMVTNGILIYSINEKNVLNTKL
ncbi:MAG: nucleotidyltransferase domain-containing protein, partial [archaeon]|nr:nucleotidyltransferase domain-containing protein [archaeon]